MKLWNIIRNFFVEYIFGGWTSSGSLVSGNLIGANEGGSLKNTNSYYVNVGGDLSIALGDWLSTTATIITLIIICVLLGFFVRWLFRLTAGLIRGC